MKYFSLKSIILPITILTLGIIIGGYLFSGTQDRSFLAFDHCQDCLNPNQLLGLFGSIGIQKFPSLIPFVVKETDKTVVIDIPSSQGEIHYVIVPKKDIKHIGDISDSDKEYLIDAYAVMGKLIREKDLKNYKIYTNGPGYQIVNYLHFHLLAEK